MTTLESKIQADLVEAMKNHQENTKEALRLIKGHITEARTAENGKRVLEENDVLEVVLKFFKQKKEAMEAFALAGNQKESDRQKEMMEIVKKYLPPMLTESEVEEIVTKTIADLGATSMKDMGKVMGFINKTYTGRVDGSMVSRIVKSKLG